MVGLLVLGAGAGCGKSTGAVSGASCGEGTKLDHGKCTQLLTCGEGTTAKDGVCELDSFLPMRCGPGTELVAGECDAIPGGTELRCGRGTVEREGQCVPSVTSGEGGAGGASDSVTCGPGTRERNGKCVPSAPDSGEGGTSSQLACGPGTRAVDDICVPISEPGGGGEGGSSGLVCGPGTHEVDSACLPDGERFELRLPATDIPADGLTHVPVLAFGTGADGQPLTDAVLVYPSRVDAGVVNPSAFSLEGFGARTSFVACNGITTPSCLGPFELQLTRASDPVHVLARAKGNLVAPGGVSSALPCLTGGNVWYMHGASNDWIYPGEITIDDGDFSASLSNNSENLHVGLSPASSSDGAWWDLYLDSTKLDAPLAVGVWNDAERWPFQSADTPGLDVSGDGRGCNMLTGAFQIETLAVTGGSVTELTVSFVQYCDGGGPLNGCVHYEAP